MFENMTFSQRQVLIARIQLSMVLLIGILLIVLPVKYFVSDFDGENLRSVFFWYGLTCVALGAISEYSYIRLRRKLDTFLDKTFLQIDTNQKGMEGEDMVENKLREMLDDRYRVLRNFKIPGREFDIDFVIIGPKGLILLEVKNYTEKMIISEEFATIIKKTGYRTQTIRLDGKKDPRRQVLYHSVILNQYVKDLGFPNVSVRGKALVFVENMAVLKGNPGVYIVSGIENLDRFLDTIPDDESFDEEVGFKVCEALEKAWKH